MYYQNFPINLHVRVLVGCSVCLKILKKAGKLQDFHAPIGALFHSIDTRHRYLLFYSICACIFRSIFNVYVGLFSRHTLGIKRILEKKYSGDAVSVTGRTDVAWISVYSEFLSEERGRICIVYTYSLNMSNVFFSQKAHIVSTYVKYL